MSFLDFVLLLPLAYGLIRGFIKGFIHELASLLAIVVGIILAYRYSANMEQFLHQYIAEDGIGLRIGSYLLILILVFAALYALSFVLTKMLQFMALGMINRIAGAVFGLLKAAIFLLILIHLAQPFLDSMNKNDSFHNSIVYQKMTVISQQLGDYLTDITVPYQENQQENSIQDSLNPGKLLPL